MSQPTTLTDLSIPSQSREIEIPAPQETVVIRLRESAEPPSYSIYREIGRLTEQLKTTKEENEKLKEKLKTFKKENVTMRGKIGELEKNDRQQIETIRSLEQAQEKLQKELETVKDAKDKLRIELEEKTSKSSKENEILREKLHNLTKEFDAQKNENRDLKRNVAKLTSEISFMKGENEKLKNDVEELKEKCNKMDRKETRLALGQVSYILEEEIWKIVLPKIDSGKTGLLYSMERWLKRNSQTGDGKAAQQRWDTLKIKLNWNECEHKPALKLLKDLRVGDAHPADVDLGEASKQLKEGEYIPEPERDFCQQIIGMIETIRFIS